MIIPQQSIYRMLKKVLEDGEFENLDYWLQRQMLKIDPEHCPFCGAHIISWGDDSDTSFSFNQHNYKCDQCGFSESISVELKAKIELERSKKQHKKPTFEELYSTTAGAFASAAMDVPEHGLPIGHITHNKAEGTIGIHGPVHVDGEAEMKVPWWPDGANDGQG